ncbi:TolC family protein [Chitinivibrio alkaliphilus]|uniref:Outer membrane efflux protein, putative n=1 Tax=Chitinivibrio alkaliphilus ACht1 TaxID=1313304 RepID=U7DDE9_9BACT|nr:TolC family protein [Chitinivibrio alkaliphilus]ERP38911.1 outer membrane efflux protein, putative [Chitinivibrio alkaliphilus ACht1]
MKRVCTVVLVSVMFSVALGQEQVTLTDLLSHAFSHSEELALLRKEREHVALQEKEHRASGLPQINASMAYIHAPRSYNPYDLSMDIEGSLAEELGNPEEVFLQNPDYTVTPGDILAYENAMGIAQTFDGVLAELGGFDLSPPKNTLNWEVKLEQVIFAQGKIKTAVEIARIAYENIDMQIEAEKLAIAKDVREKHHTYLVAQSNYEVRQSDVKLSRRTHEISRIRFDTGHGTELDTLNSKYRLKQSESSLREAAMNKRLAKKDLLTRVSMDYADDEVVILGQLTEPEFSLDVKTARGRMKEGNRTLKVLDVLAEMRDKQVDMSRTDFFPSVGAFASAGQTSLYDGVDDIDFGWNVELGVGVQIPIFHGGQRRHRMEQSRVKRRKVTSQYDQVLRQLTLALEAAYETYELAQEELVEARDMIRLTERSVSVSEVAYEMGQISQLELDQTKQQYRMSRLAENAALGKLNAAVAQIESLIGDTTLIEL